MTRTHLLELRRKVRANEALSDDERAQLFEAAFVGHHVLEEVDRQAGNRTRTALIRRGGLEVSRQGILRAIIEGLDELPE